MRKKKPKKVYSQNSNVLFVIIALICSAILIGTIIHSGKTDARLIWFLGIVIIMLIPGRIISYFMQDFKLSQKYLDEKDYTKSALHSRAFLGLLQKHGWLREISKIGLGTYFGDPKIPALINLSIAELFLGHLENAEKYLLLVIKINKFDPANYMNLVEFYLVVGAFPAARHYLATAQELGYAGPLSAEDIDAAEYQAAQAQQQAAATQETATQETDAANSLPPDAPVLTPR